VFKREDGQDTEDRVALELAECHAYNNGVVSLSYQPPTER
jgi:hypothetical protein